MNKITQQLSLDLVEISHNIIYARQNDKLTRDLIITITNNGYPYSIPSEAFVYLRGTRADGKSVFYQVAIDNHEAGVIHADIHDYVISSAGRCKLDIGIYKRIQKGTENDADEIASTEPFILYVPKEIFDENKVVNSDEGSTLAKLINESRDKIADMKSLEADVTRNEIVRDAHEAEREQNESLRKNAESDRVTNENTRKANENERQDNEAHRIAAESDRVTNENTRKANETERQDNETHRIAAESNRVTNENARNTNENKRQDNEVHRVTAESNRVTNENARKANEVKRQNDTNDAIERANDAAENANQKANDAKNAADNANSKANDLQNKLDSHYFALMEDLQSHNSSTSAHDDIRRSLSSLLTRLNALADSDDTTLDQLSEIVAYIKSNRSLIDGITSSKVNVTDIIDNLTSTAVNKPLSAKQGKALNDLIAALTNTVNSKVDKVTGKGLSTNDYTTTDKNKLAGIANGAEVNVQSDWNATDSNSDAFIKNKPTIPVATKVKGNAETTYRTGDVNLTPANLGLDKVQNTADAEKNVATAKYITQYGTPQTPSSGNKWYKIATFTLTAQYSNKSLHGIIRTTNDGGAVSNYIEYIARVKQQNPIGQIPAINISIPIYSGIDKAHLKLILTENSTTKTVCELWSFIQYGYTSHLNYILSSEGAVINNNMTLTDTEPTGLSSVTGEVHGNVSNALYLGGKDLAHVLDYRNHTNKPSNGYLPLTGGVIKNDFTNYGTHQLQVKNGEYSKAGVDIYVDKEGGNIELKNTDGKAFAIDTMDGELRLIQGANNNNTAWHTNLFYTKDNKFHINGSSKTADKLTTARTIFGKSFDGSANIGGQGLFYGSVTDTASERFGMSGLQIRENGLNGANSTDTKYAPSIGFHWSGKVGASLLMNHNGSFNFLKQDGVTPAPVYGDLVSKNQYGIYDTENRLYNVIRAYGDGAGYGTQLLFGGGGNTFIGAGEAAGNLYTAFQTASNLGANEVYNKGGENMFIASDGHVYFYSNANTAANRIGFRLSNTGNLEPVKGSTINIGTSEHKFNAIYGTDIIGRTSVSAGRIKITNTATGIGSQFRLTTDKNEGFIVYDTSLCPINDNYATLGGTGHRWKQLVSATSTISTSDRNLKKDIKDLPSDERYINFFMLLQPKSYLFKDGESGRTHVGFISQDVEDAMEECGLSSLEFAGFCKDVKKEVVEDDETQERKEIPVVDEDGNPVYEYSLRYEEFIAMNTMMIQKLYRNNKSLEDRISALEEKVSSIL